MYYTSAQDARSDLMLSGAVWVFGPILLQALFSLVPIDRIPVVDTVLLLTLPLIVTVLVPFLLIRYRKEPLTGYGLGSVDGTFAYGIVVAVPLFLAGAAGMLLAGAVLAVPAPLQLATSLIRWLGLALLAVYGTVKARDAFAGTPVSVREGVQRVGRIVLIVLGVAGLLMLFSLLGRGRAIDIVLLLGLPAAGAVGTAAVAWATLRGNVTTTLPALVTPAVLLALGPFALTFDARSLVFSIFLAAVHAVIGLVIGVLQETRRSAWGALGMAVALGLASAIGGPYTGF